MNNPLRKAALLISFSLMAVVCTATVEADDDEKPRFKRPKHGSFDVLYQDDRRHFDDDWKEFDKYQRERLKEERKWREEQEKWQREQQRELEKREREWQKEQEKLERERIKWLQEQHEKARERWHTDRERWEDARDRWDSDDDWRWRRGYGYQPFDDMGRLHRDERRWYDERLNGGIDGYAPLPYGGRHWQSYPPHAEHPFDQPWRYPDDRWVNRWRRGDNGDKDDDDDDDD